MLTAMKNAAAQALGAKGGKRNTAAQRAARLRNAEKARKARWRPVRPPLNLDGL